ncbi:hypothetical protein V865_006219 [Kwoniella europaea PYCC6329]|uniref:Uncharacterized protein n=1 Tax=Kwoniella europaea PYCC6329 TaxID=1423913 RepID=A0AAX4KS60_9TREE
MTGCDQPPASRRASPSSQEFPDTQSMHKGSPPWGRPTRSGFDGSQCPALEGSRAPQPSTNFSELPRTGFPRAGENSYEAIAFLPPPPQGFRCACQSCTQGTTTMNDRSIPSQIQSSYPPPNTFYFPTSQMTKPPIDRPWSQDAYNPLYGLMNHSKPAGMSGPDMNHPYPMPPLSLSQTDYWGDQDASSDGEMKEESNDERLKDINGSRWPDIVKPMPQRPAIMDELGEVKGLPMKLMELTESDYDWRKEPHTRPPPPSEEA